MLSFLLFCALAHAWHPKNIKNLVTFGDSYTDESRLNYFINHNGSAPPPGPLPESLMTASGGRTWPRYVVQYTGLELYDYAVSGACCSHAITPRYLPSINADFPPVLEYQLPAYKAAPVDDAVYVLWIGTNDLGVGAFLTDSQGPGKVLADYTDCVYTVLDQLEPVILMNTVPLELAPLYSNASLYGTTAVNSTYWPDKPDNRSAISIKMHQFTTSVNQVFKYRRPRGRFALFDVHQLFLDVYTHPTEYFNGTEPANVTGFEHVCTADGCVYAYNRTSSDSFMWYDPLHPSEQMDRIIAKEFVEVLHGRSKYATYNGWHNGW